MRDRGLCSIVADGVVHESVVLVMMVMRLVYVIICSSYEPVLLIIVRFLMHALCERGPHDLCSGLCD